MGQPSVIVTDLYDNESLWDIRQKYIPIVPFDRVIETTRIVL